MNEIETQFAERQQRLIDEFKQKLKKAADDVLGTMYTDVSQYAVYDEHTNFKNYLRNEFKESMKEEITNGYSYFSWAHGIRMELLKQYPTEIGNKIIEDLQMRIKSLEDHINQVRSYR